MSDEVQESFEDYLELEQFIEQLHSQGPAPLPANRTAQQAHVYSMAKLFHTVSQPVADPRPEFKAQLYQRLRKQMLAEEQLPPSQSHAKITGLPANQLPAKAFDAGHIGGKGAIGPDSAPTPAISSQNPKQFKNIYGNRQVPQPAQLPPSNLESRDAKKQKTRGVSRRTLFRSGTIAASLLASAGVGAGIEQSLQPQPDQHPTLTENTPGTWHWHPVTSVEHLGTEAVSFTTTAVTGYVIRQTGNTSDEQIIALSAACPHLGCPVQWQGDKQQFRCPCHTRIFDTTGGPVAIKNGPPHHTWLSRLETKIENGNIYVKVPT